MIGITELFVILLMFGVPVAMVVILILSARKKNRPPPIPPSDVKARRAEPGAPDNPDDAK